MIDISVLSEKYNIVSNNDKFYVNDNICDVLEFLKNAPEYEFNLLTTIVAVDLNDKIELIYQLYSIKNNEKMNLSIVVENSKAQSVVDIYKSAYFDECEIYDMFGIEFIGNKNLKRLFMPESWIGHPMLKSYKLNDERLAWNE